MGESIAEGTLSKWLKKVGDDVKRDEPIFEISTDKVDAEIPAPTAGVLAEILVLEGQTVPVQTLVARIETEKGAAIEAPTAAPSPAVSASAPAGGPPIKQSAGSAAPGPHQFTAPATAVAPANGNGLEDRLRTRSSPLVRKIAAEHGIEIAAMQGSGIQGRVTKRDIESYLASPAAARPSMHAPAGAAAHGPVPQPWPGDAVENMSKMRASISPGMPMPLSLTLTRASLPSCWTVSQM